MSRSPAGIRVVAATFFLLSGINLFVGLNMLGERGDRNRVRCSGRQTFAARKDCAARAPQAYFREQVEERRRHASSGTDVARYGSPTARTKWTGCAKPFP